MTVTNASDDDEATELLPTSTIVSLLEELLTMVSPGSRQKKRNKKIRLRKKILLANPDLSAADAPYPVYGPWEPSVGALTMLAELDEVESRAQARNEAIRQEYKPRIDALLRNPETHKAGTPEALDLALLNLEESEKRKSSNAGADQQVHFLAKKAKSMPKGKRYADVSRMTNPSQMTLDAINRGLAIFDELAGDLAPDGATIMFADPTPEQLARTGGRSYHDPNLGSIHLTPAAGARTVLHELGHWLEQNNDQVRNLRKAFQEARNQGKPTYQLDPAYYEPHERYKPITPMDDYAGRIMDTPEQSEVITMGLEFLYYDLLRFAKEDADYLMFMYDALRVR